MQNTNVFDNFDMVVSMKQELINDQLVHLVRAGVIDHRLIVGHVGKGEFKRVDSKDCLPTDDDGNVDCAYIDAEVLPRVEIAETGQDVTFVLEFRSGTAQFYEGMGPYAELKKHEMEGWQYAIPIDMGLERLKEGQVKDMRIPDDVRKQLEDFHEDMFRIDHLFMDFDDANLADFNVNMTHVHPDDQATLKQLAMFMKFYLKDRKGKDNPYILGYSLQHTDDTKPKHDVPKSMRPSGTTYSMYHDSDDDAASTLNFVMVTEGGHGEITSAAPKFDSNWIDADDDCEARMIYAHRSPIEEFFLKPIFHQLREKTHEQLSDHVDVPKGHGYENARSRHGNGYRFEISDLTRQHKKYHNRFDVSFERSGSTVKIDFDGHIEVLKRVEKNAGCEARAHASGKIHWKGNYTIQSSKDEHGDPTLDVDNHFEIVSHDTDEHMNDCAEAMKWIGKILGGILDAFTGWADDGYLSNLFADAMSVDVPDIGNLGVLFTNVAHAPRSAVLLPGGNEFYFKDPGINDEGDFMLDLTYKSRS